MRIIRKKTNLLTIICVIIFSLSILTMIYYNYKSNLLKNSKNNIAIKIIKDSELRTGPDETFPVIKTVSIGEKIKQQSVVGDWIEIKTEDNIVGWLAGWNVFGTNIKSPEEKFKESLNKFNVLLNPVFNNNKDYSLEYANNLKDELSKNKINVFITRNNNQTVDKNKIIQLINDNNIDIVINLDFTNNDVAKGPQLYYYNHSSKILSKYLEKSLYNNYIMKTKAAERNDNILIPIDKNVPEITNFIGNIKNPVDINIIEDKIYKKEYITAFSKGIENYFYYLLSLEEQQNKRKELLLNMPQKGMNIPFYYMKQDEFKDIYYGTDNNKKISDNGDIIIVLAMLVSYFDNSNKVNVNSIVEWSGNKYYSSVEGTVDKIIDDFAKNYKYNVDEIKEDKIAKINESLKNNKPIIVRFKAGKFGKRPTYKIIRGVEDGKYYINDPEDDDLKLNNYTGINEKELEANIYKAWIFTK